MSASMLRVAHVYPELLGTYGDGGNAAVLAARAGWRGLPAQVVQVRSGEPLPADCDIYLLGGGEDEPQALAADGLRLDRGWWRAVEGGAVLLAVCAGLQLLGEHFPTSGTPTHPGAGVLDLRTAPGERRTVGDLVVDTAGTISVGLLFGYENHSGRTTLGAGLQPLGLVRSGRGNGAPVGPPQDGARTAAGAGLVLATYLHGPVLAQNPALADLLLERFLPSGSPGPSADPGRLAAADRAAAALRLARARQTGVG